MCTLQEWSFYFPQSCRITVVRPCWPSQSESLGAPPPVARSCDWKAWYGAQECHLFSLIIFQFIVTCLVAMWFDFIMVVPFLPSYCGLFFVFGCRVSFLVGSSIFLVNSWTVSCDFIVFVRRDEFMSFYSSILPASPWPLLIYVIHSSLYLLTPSP